MVYTIKITMAPSFSAYLTSGREDLKQTDSDDTAKTRSHRETPAHAAATRHSCWSGLEMKCHHLNSGCGFEQWPGHLIQSYVM